MQDHMFRLKSQMMLEGDAGGGDMVLIDGHTGSMCACNASAAAMLKRLKRGASQAELARELVQKFAISTRRSEEDARSILQSLSAMGAVEIVEAEGQALADWSGYTETQPA